ncbi:MAG: hypothetical protein HAW62_01650 [Endozoicomonadaceae bacterium]|nr:hypothetical protein [Endozoicomonadaceae bacterium]
MSFSTENSINIKHYRQTYLKKINTDQLCRKPLRYTKNEDQIDGDHFNITVQGSSTLGPVTIINHRNHTSTPDHVESITNSLYHQEKLMINFINPSQLNQYQQNNPNAIIETVDWSEHEKELKVLFDTPKSAKKLALHACLNFLSVVFAGPSNMLLPLISNETMFSVLNTISYMQMFSSLQVGVYSAIFTYILNKANFQPIVRTPLKWAANTTLITYIGSASYLHAIAYGVFCFSFDFMHDIYRLWTRDPQEKNIYFDKIKSIINTHVNQNTDPSDTGQLDTNQKNIDQQDTLQKTNVTSQVNCLSVIVNKKVIGGIILSL